MSSLILIAPDAQWIAMRRGREVSLVLGIDQATAHEPAPPPGALTLDEDDVDLAFVGMPSLLVAVHRGAAPRVVLYSVPALEPVATLALDTAMRLAAITGPRIALLSLDARRVLVVRVASRALSGSPIEPNGTVELAVGLERNQLLLALAKKLEVWDAVSARPLLRLQLQLPPPPRSVGPAQGHLWATRPGSDEVFIYRLSDGRPFRHHVGSPVEDVICHALSPVIVVVTARGLVRLHCFAHSLGMIEAPWQRGEPLAQLVLGEDLQLVGGDDLWRVPIGASVAPALAPVPEPAPAPPQSAAEKLRAMRERWPEAHPAEPAAPEAPAVVATVVAAPVRTTGNWRDALGADVRHGELAELADRLAQAEAARRALVALYASYLTGEAPAIAALAASLGDWTEPLGHGELAALAMLRRRGGRVRLCAAVTDLLDGHAPRAIRLAGDGGEPLRTVLHHTGDDPTEANLILQYGRIAVIVGGVRRGLLEARLHAATAISFTPPPTRPSPWPRDAGLVIVGAAPAWLVSPGPTES
ncbi:MAG: hypothetical protein ABI867_24685 [Kofleriaceae bacterium]